MAQLVNNPPATRETWVRSLGWEDPLEKGKGKATHSSIMAQRIPWTVWSTGSQRVGHDWATFTSLHLGSLVSQRWTFKHSHLCVLSPWTETKPVTASTLRQRFCEKAKSHGYALNAEGIGKEAMTCEWKSAHGIQPPLSFRELYPAAIEKGWDLGPFAAVFVPGQMSPQVTKYK